MEFWVFENYGHWRVLIHDADCPDCTPGLEPRKAFPCGRGWHGPFDDVRKAELVALALGSFMRSHVNRKGRLVRIRWCEKCEAGLLEDSRNLIAGDASATAQPRLTDGHMYRMAVVDLDELKNRDGFRDAAAASEESA